MNTRAFMLAMIISGFAMWMVHTYVEGREASFISKYGTEVTVVVAKADIADLELINDAKVTVISVPEKFVMPGAFKEIKEVENTVATVPIRKGEQITKPRVTYPGAETGLSRQVSTGKRAIAIPITDDKAVGKLIKPGDRVDVLAPIDYAGRADLRRVQTVLQDVLVLSTGRDITNAIPLVGIKTPQVIKAMKLNTYTNYNTVTLEVTPDQAQKLVYVYQHLGTQISLVLRNNNDRKRANVPPTRLLDLLDSGEDKAEAKVFFQNRYKEQQQGGGGGRRR